MTEGLNKYDVIQIVKNDVPMWVGCLFYVDEVKSWGCQAMLPVPAQGGNQFIYRRFNTDEFILIGRGLKMYADKEEDNNG